MCEFVCVCQNTYLMSVCRTRTLWSLICSSTLFSAVRVRPFFSLTSTKSWKNMSLFSYTEQQCIQHVHLNQVSTCTTEKLFGTTGDKGKLGKLLPCSFILNVGVFLTKAQNHSCLISAECTQRTQQCNCYTRKPGIKTPERCMESNNSPSTTLLW